MLEDLRIARKYLLPPWDTFWRWDDCGEVVTRADGKAIVFRAELALVLRRLAPRGLPPLGAVLLLMSATREGWGNGSEEVGILGRLLRSMDTPARIYQMLSEVLIELDKVSALPPQLRTTSAARAELADYVFADSGPRTSSAVAAEVMATLEQGIPEEIFAPAYSVSTDDVPPLPVCGAVTALPAHASEPPPPHAGVPARGHAGTPAWGDTQRALVRDLYCLRQGLSRFDPKALALRLRTGLEEAPRPAEIEPPPAPERARALLAELEDDDELYGLARLARNLMAAVTLPRAVSDRDDLPLGGVSDISNRGPLDRLLLSELAHDDLTLAVRVATGEALYLRREQPPRTPPRRRALLLESGVRSWGVPRVFAAAVALALAATTDKHTDVACYRARGDGVGPADLTTREGLVAHLEALEPDPHPGPALSAFRAALEECETPSDAVLILAEDVLADREFQQALAESGLLPLHVATVSRDGRFELIARGTQGGKTLRTATLDLDTLFAKPKRVGAGLPRPYRAVPRDLPAILSLVPFPLRLPHQIDPKMAWHVPTLGVLALTGDRRMMLWTDTRHGALQLADNLPRGKVLWASPEVRDGVVHAVIGSSGGELHLLTARPDSASCEVVPLERSGGHCVAVCSHNGMLFLVYPVHVDVFALKGGTRAQTFPVPEGLSWQRDRFFRKHDGNHTRGWYALSFDGLAARWEEVVAPDHPRCEWLLTLFERAGVDGPVGVTAQGRLVYTATGETKEVEHAIKRPVSVRAISRAGDRLVLSGEVAPGQPPWAYSVDTGSGHVECHGYCSFPYGDPASLVERLTDFVAPRPLRTSFHAIGVGGHGSLVLQTSKRSYWGIYFSPGEGKIIGKTWPGSGRGGVTPPLPSYTAEFQPAPAPRGVGYTLKVATWTDGSKAFLDSRGMLHLKSSDPVVPEVTLVLTDGQLSAWCADGIRWGVPYFIGEGHGVSAGTIFHSAIQPFVRRLT